MPWKEPGKGDQDPWKSGDQPPDLDEVFQNMSSKVRSLFGGSGGGSAGSGSSGGGIFPMILLVAGFWLAWDAVHIIDEAERGVVLRFGAFTRELQPGFNLTLPRPIESLTKINVSAVRSVDDQGNMLTEDENLVEFNYQVQYLVNNAQDFMFNVRSPEFTLGQAAESALRESVGSTGLDEVLEGASRVLVAQESRRVLQETMDRYEAGIQVTQFNLTDVQVPNQVREAYSDVIRAREDRERFIEEARVHENSVVPEARGRGARIVQEAQGYRDATVALADGEADRFVALLKEYQLAPSITRKRLYLETMQSVFSRSNKVMLNVDTSGNILYLPLDGMSGGASASAASRLPPIVPTDQGVQQPDADRRRSANREGR